MPPTIYHLPSPGKRPSIPVSYTGWNWQLGPPSWRHLVNRNSFPTSSENNARSMAQIVRSPAEARDTDRHER